MFDIFGVAVLVISLKSGWSLADDRTDLYFCKSGVAMAGNLHCAMSLSTNPCTCAACVSMDTTTCFRARESPSLVPLASLSLCAVHKQLWRVLIHGSGRRNTGNIDESLEFCIAI
jgi:hypothetical protein